MNGSASTPEQLRALGFRVERIYRFMGRQRLKREWVRLSNLARQYSLEDPAEGFEKLLESIRAGAFEVGGRSRLLYLHPGVSLAKMTRQGLDERFSLGGIPRQALISAYVAPCWVPSDMAAEWLQKNPPQSLAPAPVRPKRGRPVGSTKYDDTDAIELTAKLIAEGETARVAARRAIVELGLTVPEWGNSEEAIEQRIRIPALALARARADRS